MKNILLALALLTPVMMNAQNKKKGPKTFDLIVGAYTTDNSKGISVYRFYAETGRLAYLSQSDDVPNPSYLCIDKDKKFVYAVSETDNGEIYAYSFEPKGGVLTFINKQKSGGAAPCYISVDEDRKHVFVANYSSGSFAALPVNEDGSLKPPAQVIQDKGSGVNKQRQEGPHAHSAFLSPDEKYVLLTDLGTDKISIKKYDSGDSKPLGPAPVDFVSVAPGSGPRHLDFTPDKKYMYVVQELTGAVTAFEFNGGKPKQIQSVTMLADGFRGAVGAADIHVSPDGRFVYASNRGDANEIVTYAINSETGMLTFIDRTPTRGKAPRNFVIDPTGKFLLVGNQDTNTINVFKLDPASGKLGSMVTSTQVDKPVCLKFAPAM
ncbi:lactonase family protein [Mucilaginibacter sp. UR6-1]|uniref:lactonase family protein n=1 Tax=Mucilaginibacter sp. UR6-1 TaxID=1435643 RepID=UPI001E33284C|nr:lactonase family protein [Mucilaginibacter sp. UR6-1]MCC8410665.1 lactonase family protein [Mucilaginibacter sp. UR6-1]